MPKSISSATTACATAPAGACGARAARPTAACRKPAMTLHRLPELAADRRHQDRSRGRNRAAHRPVVRAVHARRAAGAERVFGLPENRRQRARRTAGNPDRQRHLQRRSRGAPSSAPSRNNRNCSALTDRLADQKPLADDERSQLEQDSARRRRCRRQRWMRARPRSRRNCAGTRTTPNSARTNSWRRRNCSKGRRSKPPPPAPRLAQRSNRCSRAPAGGRGRPPSARHRRRSTGNCRLPKQARQRRAQPPASRRRVRNRASRAAAKPSRRRVPPLPHSIRPRRSTPASTPCCRRTARRSRRKPTPTAPPRWRAQQRQAKQAEARHRARAAARHRTLADATRIAANAGGTVAALGHTPQAGRHLPQ